jgi:Arc/MetJ-type ribon-helix-helix transcriptional regulator
MKYLRMIHQGTTPTPLDPVAWAALPADEQQAIYEAYKAINETPGFTPGHGLQQPETATTVRVQDGRTITTDGPFVDTKESINGYLIYDAPDLDAAIALAARSWSGSDTAERSGSDTAERSGSDTAERSGSDTAERSGSDTAEFREHWGRVVATLVGFLGDIDLAEEAAQEAFVLAVAGGRRRRAPAARTARGRARTTHIAGGASAGGAGMVIGMASKKITITLDDGLVQQIRTLVDAGRASSVSGFVQHAVGVALDDVAGWGAMLAQALAETGGPMSADERAWADTALGVPKRRRRSAA